MLCVASHQLDAIRLLFSILTDVIYLFFGAVTHFHGCKSKYKTRKISLSCPSSVNYISVAYGLFLYFWKMKINIDVYVEATNYKNFFLIFFFLKVNTQRTLKSPIALLPLSTLYPRVGMPCALFHVPLWMITSGILLIFCF